MLRPDLELCRGWSSTSLTVGQYVRGPDVPAGYTFFGKPVWRTCINCHVDSSINTISVPGFLGGELVDVWGCARASLTGAVQGVLHVGGFINAGWNGAGGIRVRLDPTIGFEVVSGSINEMGGSSENLPFPDADVELVVFWVR